MKRLILALALLGSLALPSFAQVNTVPQVGVISGVQTKQTYRAVSIGLAPAASATDFFCIAGSNTRLVRVTGFTASGVAGTLNTVPVVVVRRAAANTAGTAASTIANPANTIGKLDSNNATATATLIAYTANPTITDSSPTYIATGNLTTPTAAAGTNSPRLEFNFGANLPQFAQQLTLRSNAEQICLNMQGSSISSGVLQVTVGWTEE